MGSTWKKVMAEVSLRTAGNKHEWRLKRVKEINLKASEKKVWEKSLKTIEQKTWNLQIILLFRSCCIHCQNCRCSLNFSLFFVFSTLFKDIHSHIIVQIYQFCKWDSPVLNTTFIAEIFLIPPSPCSLHLLLLCSKWGASQIYVRMSLYSLYWSL